MAFKDLAKVYDPALYLPINGKTYKVPGPNAEAWPRLMALKALAWTAASGGDAISPEMAERLNLQDGDDDQYMADNLGAAYEEMKTDGVAWSYIEHAAHTAFMNWTLSSEAAQAYWNQEDLAGKAAPGLPPTETPTGAAAEGTTRTSASRTGTSAKPKPKPNSGKPKAGRSPSLSS